MGDVGKDSQGIHRGGRPGGCAVKMGMCGADFVYFRLLQAGDEEDDMAEVLEGEKCI